jgi:hypothetical protein
MSVCLIRDDDELCVPIAPSPIDAYRGTGKTYMKVIGLKKRTEIVRSSECAYRCMSHQLGGGCNCDESVKMNRDFIDEIDEEMKAFDKNTLVGFGKYKNSKWYTMYDDGYERGVKSWSDWYLKNCTNKGKFYQYLRLLKERSELCDEIRYTQNPNFD